MSSSLIADFSSGLLRRQAAPCVSLYQPTHRRHPENQQDPIRFRNLVKTVAASLDREYHNGDAHALLEPFRALADDADFWNHADVGLAVLAAPGFFRAYRLPRTVPERAIVADSLHLKPLIRITQSADSFQVLALTRRAIRLFEGNRDGLAEIELAPGVRTMAEALGDQLTEPHLTVASYGSPGGGLAQRHGHGSRKDEVDVDTERYFRAVDRFVLEHHSRPPLVLVALKEHQALFRGLSQNSHLVSDGPAVDPGALSAEDLRDRAWKAVEPRYLERLADLIERFGEARAGARGSDDLEEVANAAVAGRVATLLIDADQVVPGRIHRESGHLELGALDHPDMDDALDDMGELVLETGGNVIVVPGERMPTGTGVAAIYRF